MIANPPHNRKLGVSGVALTMQRNPKSTIKLLGDVRDRLESIMIASGYLDKAPFSWVTVVIRFGLKNEVSPHYGKVSKKYGDLPLSIEVDVSDLPSKSDSEITRVYFQSVLKALIHAGQKHSLPTEALEYHFESKHKNT